MSSSPAASPLPPLWCASCHVVVDNSSHPCPLCGLDSITEITDSRILTILGLLHHESSADSNSRIGDGDANVQRNPSLRIEEGNLYISFSPRHVFTFLAFLARLARVGNTVEDSTLASESHPSSSPSSLSLPVELEEPSDEDHGFGFDLLYESSANTTSGLDSLRFDEGLAGEHGENDDFGRHAHQDEGFFNPVVDFILHHVVQDEANRYGSVPASKAAVAALPTLNFSKDCFQEDDACCAVCREVFEFGEEVKELPCKHIYHSGCILPWLEMHSSCPLCRRELPVEDYPGAEEFVVPPAEAGEASLALFEISVEGIHVLSFVLFGAQTNEDENLQTHESTRDIESHGEEGASAVEDQEDENEFSIIDNQEAIIDPKAGSGNLEGSVERSMREEVVTDTSVTNYVDSSSIELSGTRYSGDESALRYVDGDFERSNNVTEGLQSTEITSQQTRAQFSTIDRLGSSIDTETRGVQFTAFEDHYGSGLESSSGLSNMESSFAPSIRNFFSWVFGSPSHMVNSDGG